MSETRCSQKVYPRERYGAFNGYQCSHKAAVTRDGKPFCNMHDPERRKAKDAERSANWNAKWDAADAKAKRDSAILKACEGLTTKEVEQAIGTWKIVKG